MVTDQCEEGKPCPQTFLSNASIIVDKEMIRHDYKPGKGLGKSLQGVIELITQTASEKFFGVGFRPTPTDVRWADDRKNDGWVLPLPVSHLCRTFVKPKYNEEEEDKAIIAGEIEEICGAMRKILYEAHVVQPGEGLSTAEVLSNNAALNNITCLRTSCPDSNTMSNCEIMNQDPEYHEEEAFRKINRELEQFENKPKPNLNDIEPVNLGLSVDLVVHKLPTYPDCPSVQQKQRKFKTDISDKIKEEVTKQLKAGLNPAKCAFGVPSGKLLGFVVSWRGIELDLTNIKSIRDLPPPRTKKDVMSLLGRLNYIGRFIAQLTSTCEPIFKFLKKDASIKWTNECQEAFDKIKEYLSNPPVLVPPEPGRPLFLYLTVLENSFGCVLEKHDVTEKREHAIYYLSKKFTSYEAKYTLLERTCCTLTWVAQKLRHYLQAYTTYLITRYIPRCHNELADALATLASMLPYPSNAHIDPLEIQIKERHGYCNMVEVELNIQPWYHDIKRFLKTKEYPEQASGDQKRTIRWNASGFFLSGDILYKRTPNHNLLRCVDAKEAGRIMYEVHVGVCGPHMNGYVLAKKKSSEQATTG
ncbi:uncharacterized protein [Nicotiana sylvestris]|uniref:uncharacterized protein n=1 Tax=Nicotiana sylvestris TaxID=4096 RepID=UPI00388C64BD